VITPGTNVETDTGKAGRPRTAEETQQTKGERRANRLKLARPDLVRRVKTSISAKAAVKIGGYQNADALETDLKIKEAAMGIRP
jgi:hypothetical protein